MNKNKNLYVVANWKMNPPTLKQAEQLFNSVVKNFSANQNTKLIFCPPFVWLAKLANKSSKNVFFGAQNIFWEKEKGAFTGEVSAAMITDLGCEYVILGHSERRTYFGETDEIINKKVKSALSLKLKPILCIGEKEREQDEFGKSILPAKILEAQLKICLEDVSRAEAASIIVAYEPRWAIGTGFADTPESTFETILFIKRVLTKIYNKSVANKIPILYGGSISEENAKSFVERGGANGLLVGGASLREKEFSAIIKNVSEF